MKKSLLYICFVLYGSLAFAQQEGGVYIETKYLFDRIGQPAKMPLSTLYRSITLSEDGSIELITVDRDNEKVNCRLMVYSETEGKYLLKTVNENTLDEKTVAYIGKLFEHISRVKRNDKDKELKLNLHGAAYLEVKLHGNTEMYVIDGPGSSIAYSLTYSYIKRISNPENGLQAEYWPNLAFTTRYDKVALNLTGKEISIDEVFAGASSKENVISIFGFPHIITTDLAGYTWGYYLKDRGMMVLKFDVNYMLIKSKTSIVYKMDVDVIGSQISNFPLISD